MSWKSKVYTIIKQICPVDGMFNLHDIYGYEKQLQNLYPDNNHIEAKIRQILQYLRDDGIIEFSDHAGEYKRLK